MKYALLFLLVFCGCKNESHLEDALKLAKESHNERVVVFTIREPKELAGYYRLEYERDLTETEK